MDLLNFGFEPGALRNNPDFFDEVGETVERLRENRLIRFATADAQNEENYVQAIESGAFDAISIGFHFATPGYADAVLPVARRQEVGVITRAVFMKGALFEMADQADIDDLDQVARASIRWCLDHDPVTSVLVGVDTAAQLERNLAAVETDGMTTGDEAILERLRATDAFRERVREAGSSVDTTEHATGPPHRLLLEFVADRERLLGFAPGLVDPCSFVVQDVGADGDEHDTEDPEQQEVGEAECRATDE